MKIERLGPEAAPAYRAFMLRAYFESPTAFTATVEERAAKPMDFWLQRLDPAPEANEWSLGAWQGEALTGAVTLERQTRPKSAHKALLLGMVVAPEARGQGLGQRLVEALLREARARDGLKLITLTLTEGNAAAEQLYTRCGFQRFGVEPLAIQDQGRFFNKVHMALVL
jgi:RimJ/RimL family protein N-acetyltransferase